MKPFIFAPDECAYDYGNEGVGAPHGGGRGFCRERVAVGEARPDEVVDVLRAARKGQAEERLACGSGYGAGQYVASDEFGQPYHPNLLTFRWGRMLVGLGIERVRLHDVRHSCATLMHLRQVPIAVVAAWLGHASAAFTLSVYAHSQDDAVKAAAGGFARVDNS
jgi:integrase